MIAAQEFQQALHLECLVSSTQDSWDLRTPDLNRPGMQFCGFYEYFAFERPQVIGKVEMTYLERQQPDHRRVILEKYFSYRLPCVIICRGLTPPEELLELARRQNVWVFRSPQVTSKLVASAIHYLNRCLAPHILRHGVLLDVYGVGILLTGRSGVGKSEAALELIKRGHQLVADDVVDICRIADDRLIGTCPKAIRHYMEIRGLGLIDVRALYGIGAVTVSKSIDLVIELETWDETKSYDRIGMEDEMTEILGVRIPYQTMPVKPGRNLAIILEVAARNLSLRKLGYHSAKVLLESLQDSDMNE